MSDCGRPCVSPVTGHRAAVGTVCATCGFDFARRNDESSSEGDGTTLAVERDDERGRVILRVAGLKPEHLEGSELAVILPREIAALIVAAFTRP